MAFVVESLALLLCVAAYLLYLLGTRGSGFWRRHGVACPPMYPFLGTQTNIMLGRESPVDFYRRIYESYPDSPYVGLLRGCKPNLLLRDPDLVKQVLTKDFEFFPERGMPYNEKVDPLSGHLFSLGGVRWKSLRIKMTPTFTSGKIKRMFPLMRECGTELSSLVEASAGDVVEFKEVLGRFSTDVIGTCAFGVACNSLKDPSAEFRKHAVDIFAVSPTTVIRMLLFVVFPPMLRFMPYLSNTSFGRFFLRVMKENIRNREEKQVKRDDFLDLLIQLKNKGRIVDDTVDEIEDPYLRTPVSTTSDEFKFDDNVLAAQAFVFFAAGFETSSTTMSFCLLELAYHPEIQTKLHIEIDAVLRKHGGISYEALSQMPFLDKVIAETLRKYPPLSYITRQNVRPYRVPGSKLVLPEATRVFIPVIGLHYDPHIYPDPECFDPERFSAEEKASRHPYTYLPFGEGPRICIGMRFGLLQTKLGLISVLSNCTVEPSPLTEYPVKFKKFSFVTTSESACHLIVRKREPSSVQRTREELLEQRSL